jgi:hypothetical protein
MVSLSETWAAVNCVDAVFLAFFEDSGNAKPD